MTTLNRAGRRRQKAEWRRRRAQWERGVLAFHEQAQGAFAARLFRVDGAPPPPDAAAGIINWCGQAAAHRDVGCIVCGAVFGRDGQPQAFLVLAPYGRTATEGLVSGVCRSCAAQSDTAVYEAARRQLAMIWPATCGSCPPRTCRGPEGGRDDSAAGIVPGRI